MSCPFYGKHATDHFPLIDQHGNQCAIIVRSYSPCVMEVTLGRAPEMRACPLLKFIGMARERIIERVREDASIGKAAASTPDDLRVPPVEFP